jgi:hypothetical protein
MATDAEPERLRPLPAEVGQSVIALADPTQSRKLSEEFALILKEFEVETVTLREVLALLHGRGYVLLVMLLALPFCQPIPLPGLSTPLGLIIAIIGGRLAMGHKPWLPARLLDTRLPPNLFAKVFALTQKIVRWFERLLRPRLLWMTATPFREQMHAIPIVVCALLLLLPLPLPFSNVIPAWGVMLIAGGLLERDGKFIVGGYAAAVASIVYFALSGSLMWLAMKQAYERFMGWFG